ncbi:MAG: DUF1972 domain-containing protein [Microbacteriaceae bacterium]|nr:DUF1972 domain-containing protein [Microbacteriaceae bacterium]
MIGTRGVPASYGGFETAVEEIGSRLADRGHRVTVYCRNSNQSKPREHLGMTLIHLPAIPSKVLETLSHTALSVFHTLLRRKTEVVFLFNAANSPFLPLLRWKRIPTAVHVDGLEWQRGKWGPLGRRYYRGAEQLAVRGADALIADAQGIADYYRNEFHVTTELLSYGTTVIKESAADRLVAMGLSPKKFHLVVARFEPENHVDVIVEGYAASAAKYPLIVVGSAPYAADYTERITAVAAEDPRIRLIGGVWDQKKLDQLYANALSYIHGHSVGGTNPSLLRAMGAGTSVLAWDVNFNRDVVSTDGSYFNSAESIAVLIEVAENDPVRQEAIGAALRLRAARDYDWDVVADGYEALALRLDAGYSSRGTSRGRRAQNAATGSTPERVGAP